MAAASCPSQTPGCRIRRAVRALCWPCRGAKWSLRLLRLRAAMFFYCDYYYYYYIHILTYIYNIVHGGGPDHIYIYIYICGATCVTKSQFLSSWALVTPFSCLFALISWFPSWPPSTGKQGNPFWGHPMFDNHTQMLAVKPRARRSASRSFCIGPERVRAGRPPWAPRR